MPGLRFFANSKYLETPPALHLSARRATQPSPTQKRECPSARQPLVRSTKVKTSRETPRPTSTLAPSTTITTAAPGAYSGARVRMTRASAISGFFGTGSTRASRIVGPTAVRPSSLDQRSSVLQAKSRPAQNSSAVCPLARQAATRSVHSAAFAILAHYSATRISGRRGPCIGYLGEHGVHVRNRRGRRGTCRAARRPSQSSRPPT